MQLKSVDEVKLYRSCMKSFSLKGQERPQKNEIEFFSFLDISQPRCAPRALVAIK